MTQKPSWRDAPGWAQYLAMDRSLTWYWHEQFPIYRDGCWLNDGNMSYASKNLGKDSLEERPPIISISIDGDGRK